MSNETRAQSIDKLGISGRTASFLQSLHVRTIRDLLALPRIRAPHSGVATELRVLFERMELVHEGWLEGPASRQ